jgi:hypothetical protein
MMSYRRSPANIFTGSPESLQGLIRGMNAQ